MATTTPTHAQRRRADARTIRALRAALDLTTRQLALYALPGHEASFDIIAANRALLLKTGSHTIYPMKNNKSEQVGWAVFVGSILIYPSLFPTRNGCKERFVKNSGLGDWSTLEKGGHSCRKVRVTLA